MLLLIGWTDAPCLRRRFNRWKENVHPEPRNSVFLGSIQNSMNRGSKRVQIIPNYAGRITRVLRTNPRKESTSQSMVWKESKIWQTRTGFSLKTEKLKNLVTKRLVIPKGFVLGKRDWNHVKELKEPSQSRTSWSIKWNRKSLQRKARSEWDQNEFNSPEGTRREGPPFPQNLLQKLHKSMA